MALGNQGSSTKAVAPFNGKLLISTKSYEGLSSDTNAFISASANPKTVTSTKAAQQKQSVFRKSGATPELAFTKKILISTKKIKPAGVAARAPKPLPTTKIKVKRNPAVNMHKLHPTNGF